MSRQGTNSAHFHPLAVGSVLTPGAREVFAEHGYRLWDISPLMTAAGH
jgi:hypothetical protein